MEKITSDHLCLFGLVSVDAVPESPAIRIQQGSFAVDGVVCNDYDSILLNFDHIRYHQTLKATTWSR
jgi:hypothetical protein